MKREWDVYLQDTRTGEIKVYHDDFDHTEDSLYIYEDGNYKCDCNRSLFMYGNDTDKHLECNVGDNLIRIVKIVEVDEHGNVLRDNIYSEDIHGNSISI